MKSGEPLSISAGTAYLGRSGSRTTLGQSTVELSLALVVLLIICLGVVDVARLFIAEVDVANAAREGARYGALHPSSTSAIRQRVFAELGAATVGSDPNQVAAVSVSQVPLSNPPGSTAIQVTVTYNYITLTPIPFGPGTLALQNSAAMLVLGN